MIESFRHKGLEEIHRTGKTRRIGADYGQEGYAHHAIAGSRATARGFEHRRVSVSLPAGNPAKMVDACQRKLSPDLRLVR